MKHSARSLAAVFSIVGAIAGFGAMAAARQAPPRAAADALSPLAPLAACDGSAWQRVNIDVAIQDLAGDPAGGYVYAGSRDGVGVYRSQLSDGERWTPLTSIGRSISSIGVAPGGIPLLVGLYGGGVARSDDHGDTFFTEALEPYYITSVAADETGAYAAASRSGFRGVYVDRGDGGGYLPLGSFDVDTFVIWRLAIAPDGTPWIGTDRSGPYRWDGTEWRPATDSGVARSTVHSIAFDSRDASTMFLGLGDSAIPDSGETAAKGLLRSRDGGASYEPARFAARSVPSIVPSAVDGRAFVSVWGSGLHMTTDHGATWQRLHSPTGAPPYFQALLALVPSGRTPLQCELLFAGGAEGLWVRNVGSGRAWLQPTYLPVTRRD